MNITVEKAQEFDRLKKFIADQGEDFRRVVHNDKILYVAYMPLHTCCSCLIRIDDKVYGFINSKLTKARMRKELDILFEDKELHRYSKSEISKLDDFMRQQKLKQKIIKDVTYGDIENMVKNYELRIGELTGVFSMIDIVKKFNKLDSYDLEWNNARLLAYAFKFGELQGKRAERGRKKPLVSGGNPNE